MCKNLKKLLWRHASPKLSADAAAASALPTHKAFQPAACAGAMSCRHTCMQCQKAETPGARLPAMWQLGA